MVSGDVMRNTAMWGFCISGKRCSGVALPGEGVNREEEEEEGGGGGQDRIIVSQSSVRTAV